MDAIKNTMNYAWKELQELLPDNCYLKQRVWNVRKRNEFVEVHQGIRFMGPQYENDNELKTTIVYNSEKDDTRILVEAFNNVKEFVYASTLDIKTYFAHDLARFLNDVVDEIPEIRMSSRKISLAQRIHEKIAAVKTVKNWNMSDMEDFSKYLISELNKRGFSIRKSNAFIQASDKKYGRSWSIRLSTPMFEEPLLIRVMNIKKSNDPRLAFEALAQMDNDPEYERLMFAAFDYGKQFELLSVVDEICDEIEFAKKSLDSQKAAAVKKANTPMRATKYTGLIAKIGGGNLIWNKETNQWEGRPGRYLEEGEAPGKFNLASSVRPGKTAVVISNSQVSPVNKGNMALVWLDAIVAKSMAEEIIATGEFQYAAVFGLSGSGNRPVLQDLLFHQEGNSKDLVMVQGLDPNVLQKYAAEEDD